MRSRVLYMWLIWHLPVTVAYSKRSHSLCEESFVSNVISLRWPRTSLACSAPFAQMCTANYSQSIAPLGLAAVRELQSAPYRGGQGFPPRAQNCSGAAACCNRRNGSTCHDKCASHRRDACAPHAAPLHTRPWSSARSVPRKKPPKPTRTGPMARAATRRCDGWAWLG